MIYDPCTCDNSSTLQALAHLINVSSISLEMVGGGTIEQVLSTGTSSVSLYNLVNGAEKQGTKVYKSLDKFKNFGESIYDKYHFKLYKNDHIEEYESMSIGNKLKFESDYKKHISLPGWVKGLPKIGYALGIAEYLIGGGKTTPPKPISFEANLQFNITGNNSTPIPSGVIDIYTPGSIWGSNKEREVKYNNIMGVVNLLRTPEFEVAEDDEKVLGSPPFFAAFRSIKLKMVSDLEYVVNPASGLKVVDIKAALVIENREDGGLFDLVSPPTPDYSTSNIFFYETETGLKRWQTPFFPIQCLKDIVINAGGHIVPAFRSPSDYIDRLRLKLLVTLERDENDPFYDADAEQVIFMAEYKANTIEAPFGSINSTNSYDQILLRETVSNISLTADQTIYAWSTIELGENIVTNGNQLTLIAGDEIIVNTADLPPNIDLIIGYPTPCEGISPPITPQALAAFCTGGGYNPVGQIVADNEERTFHNQDQLKETFEITASPNPFTDFIDLHYTNTTLEQNARINIADISGRQISSFEIGLQNNGKSKFRIPTSEWANGFYILTFETATSYENIKLVKQ